MVLAASSALACDGDQAALDVREAIYSYDIDGVEATLAESQLQFEDGARSIEEIRCLYSHFGAMRPKTAEFVGHWLDVYPNSPYARAAKALSLVSFSTSLRGDRPASSTYLEALTRFHDMQAEAWALASDAIQAQPRLVPASDALILSANANRKSAEAREVLAAIMSTDANQGSVALFQSQVLPEWNGSFADVAWLCQNWAGAVPGAGPQAVELCLLEGGAKFPETRARTHELLARGTFPQLDHLRLPQLTGSEASRQDAILAQGLLGHGHGTLDDVKAFERLAARYDLSPMLEHWTRQRYDRALTALEHAPADPGIIADLQTGILIGEIRGNGVMVITRQTLHHDLLDLAHRRLIASPYDPALWSAYLTTLQATRPVSYAEAEPFRVNALVYANHAPHALAHFLRQKLQTHRHLSQADTDMIPEDVAVDLAAIDETDVICPTVRAYRMFQQTCSMARDRACHMASQEADALSQIVNTAAGQGMCFDERNLPIGGLAFTEIAVPSLEY